MSSLSIAFSDFVLQDFYHFLVADSEVAHGHGGVSVIKALAQDFKAYSVLRPLDIAEGFSQGMSTIVSGQIDGSGPSLDHTVDGLDCERPVLSGSGLEKIILRFTIFT